MSLRETPGLARALGLTILGKLTPLEVAMEGGLNVVGLEGMLHLQKNHHQDAWVGRIV